MNTIIAVDHGAEHWSDAEHWYTFHCPYCSEQIMPRLSLSEKYVRCPSCGEHLSWEGE